MARRNEISVEPSTSVPQINRYGSIQAHHALLKRAARRGVNFNGRPTGVFQDRDKLYLYEDIGVGRVVARIVKAVEPLNAWDYLPRPHTGAA